MCVLERLLERGDRVAAFIGLEGGAERDFCPEILELCDAAAIPARSGHKLGEEIVRWLEDRIRPELAVIVGVDTEVPLSIGGNCRFGLVELIDMFQSKSCPGVILRQRGQDLIRRELPWPEIPRARCEPARRGLAAGPPSRSRACARRTRRTSRRPRARPMRSTPQVPRWFAWP